MHELSITQSVVAAITYRPATGNFSGIREASAVCPRFRSASAFSMTLYHA